MVGRTIARVFRSPLGFAALVIAWLRAAAGALIAVRSFERTAGVSLVLLVASVVGAAAAGLEWRDQRRIARGLPPLVRSGEALPERAGPLLRLYLGVSAVGVGLTLVPDLASRVMAQDRWQVIKFGLLSAWMLGVALTGR